jgi:hypothetical protein
MSVLLHFLENQLTNGGQVVSLTLWLPLSIRKIHANHFCYRLSRPQGHSAAGRMRSIEKKSNEIGNRTRDLPACSIVTQPTTLPHAPLKIVDGKELKFSHLYICVRP